MTMTNLSSSTNFNPPSSFVIKVLWRQQQELITKHPDGVAIIINEDDPLDLQANIEGPKDTPYEGGIFKVKIVIGSEFPNVAPKGYFVTKIFHPNVSDKGEICVNTLKKDWNAKQWSLYNVLEVKFSFKYVLGHKVFTHHTLPRKFFKRRGRQTFHGGLRKIFQNCKNLYKCTCNP
jgi:ubiquitin-protein ligase